MKLCRPASCMPVSRVSFVATSLTLYMIGLALSHVAWLLEHLLATGTTSEGASSPAGRICCQPDDGDMAEAKGLLGVAPSCKYRQQLTCCWMCLTATRRQLCAC